jgi:hypothetical protein
MKAQRESRGIALLFNLGSGREWVVNSMTWLLYPQEWPGTHCVGGWVGCKLVWMGLEKLPTPGVLRLCSP